MQSLRSYSIEDDNNVKLLLTHIRKIQNIAEVKVLEINKTTLSTKVVVYRKRPNINV